MITKKMPVCFLGFFQLQYGMIYVLRPVMALIRNLFKTKAALIRRL